MAKIPRSIEGASGLLGSGANTVTTAGVGASEDKFLKNADSFLSALVNDKVTKKNLSTAQASRYEQLAYKTINDFHIRSELDPSLEDPEKAYKAFNESLTPLITMVNGISDKETNIKSQSKVMKQVNTFVREKFLPSLVKKRQAQLDEYVNDWVIDGKKFIYDDPTQENITYVTNMFDIFIDDLAIGHNKKKELKIKFRKDALQTAYDSLYNTDPLSAQDLVEQAPHYFENPTKLVDDARKRDLDNFRDSNFRAEQDNRELQYSQDDNYIILERKTARFLRRTDINDRDRATFIDSISAELAQGKINKTQHDALINLVQGRDVETEANTYNVLATRIFAGDEPDNLIRADILAEARNGNLTAQQMASLFGFMKKDEEMVLSNRIERENWKEWRNSRLSLMFKITFDGGLITGIPDDTAYAYSKFIEEFDRQSRGAKTFPELVNAFNRSALKYSQYLLFKNEFSGIMKRRTFLSKWANQMSIITAEDPDALNPLHILAHKRFIHNGMYARRQIYDRMKSGQLDDATFKTYARFIYFLDSLLDGARDRIEKMERIQEAKGRK